MKKFFSLIKVAMSQNMNLFRISTKKDSKKSKIALPIFLGVVFLFSIWTYANMIMESLEPLHLEYVVLTLFVGFASVLTIIEGIYKSSELIFNCKDDDLLLSLPIKRSTVFFIRVFKFYVFELMYNSLLLLPAMFVYATKVKVTTSYYAVSLIALLLIPIIPIIISCIIGAIVSFFSSIFKRKSLAQIVVAMLFIILVFFASFNLEGLLKKLATNGKKINDIITKVYYPAGEYVNLVTYFNILNLVRFILIHIIAFALMMFLFSKAYFKINSRVKVIKRKKLKESYKTKQTKPLKSLIKKEFNKFISIPVFVINTVFGLALFIVIAIVIAIKFNEIEATLTDMQIPLTLGQIRSYIPIIVYIIVNCSIFLTSITSSMISLEGKAFNAMKSLPITPAKVIFSKVLTAVMIMLPLLFIGEIVLYVRFKLGFVHIVIITISTIVWSILNETVGIIVNLKYPKMNAESDAEVVKQSISSMIAVFIGMGIMGVTIGCIVGLLILGISSNITMIIITLIHLSVLVCLSVYIRKKGIKLFNEITA